MYNGQNRKIKIIQEYEKKIINYGFEHLLFYEKDIYTQFLIYTVDNIQIDDVTNKNFKLDKTLNLAYFEGKSTNDGVNGYINYSKKRNYKIYMCIPEFEKLEKQIISSHSNNTQPNTTITLANYKKIFITEYGQDIYELFKLKLINYNEATFMTTYSIGLMNKTKFSVESVELNGKNVEYSKDNSSIKIKNVGALNNQFAEIRLKYKYFTNLDKSLTRKESFITSNIKKAYCKIILLIPEKYVVLSSKEIFKKSPKYNNMYYYNGISNEEEIHEYFEFCYQKANWDIYKEFSLSSTGPIKQCSFYMNRLYKGGNLKINKFDVIKNNGEFIDDEMKGQYTFNFTDLQTNRTSVGFKLNAENSTSNYQILEKPELITKIPEEDKQFFISLSNSILQQDKSNDPIYKKLGRWVHNYLKYNISYKGKKYTAKEIYNMKTGVCEHFT